MDPASTIGLVLACYQVASEIGCQCFRYVRGVQQSKNDIDLVSTQMQTFQISLRHVQQTLADEEEISRDNSRLELLKEVIYGQFTSLPLCLQEMEKIRDGLSKVGAGGRCKELLQKLAWPLKREDVDKALLTLERFAAAVDRALTIDTSATVRQIHSTSNNIESNTKQLLSSNANAEAQQTQRDELHKQDEERREGLAAREKILRWLAHPNVGEIHNVVSRARKSAETGRWFLDGAVFQEFKETPRSLLWLHGDSGCGKSVLCSAIIDQIKLMCRDSPRYHLAYWYFSVNDMRRRSLENLMRALITQVMTLSAPAPPILRLWEAKNGGIESPTLSELISTFRDMLARNRGVGDHLDLYLVIDALDEANEAEHADIIATLQSFILAIDYDIHVLITSRSNSITIGKGWHDAVETFRVGIGRQDADEDILAHVTERLKNDEDLRKWSQGIQKDIKEALTRNSAGMFRWVDCQLQAISRCRKPKELSRALTEPPRDLHDFYARELANVEHNAVEDVRKLLVWMTFPQRPLTTQELVEILAVDLRSDPPCFDEEDRMPRPEDILKLCGSLVSTNTAPDSGDGMGNGAEIRTFAAAHASVVDFLQAGRVRIGSETVDSFTKAAANLEMAETCLVYLLHLVEDEKSLNEIDLPKYPFARLSAKMWHTFYRGVLISPGQQELGMDRLRKLALKLLTTPESTMKWSELCEPKEFTRARRNDIFQKYAMPAMYYAATLGLPDIVNCLIKDGHDVDGGKVLDYRTPLIGASRHGRERVVSILLNNGADPNYSGTCKNRPLAIAMKHGHAEVVKILLNAEGINVNCRKPHHPDEDGAQPISSGFSMSVISDIVYDEYVVKDTSDSKDAMILPEFSHCHPGQCQTLISDAAASGSLDFVKALLAAGADANIEGGYEGTALEIACYNGRVDIVRSLLKGGANPNRPGGGSLGIPLQAVCKRSQAPLTPASVAIVNILLNAGVDVNQRGGHCGTALVAACHYGGRAEFVRILLENGADPNISKCSDYDNALQTACFMHNHEIVKLLLDNGADPNIHGGEFGSPLHAAFYAGSNGIIDMLLQRGADSKYEGGRYRTIFQAALGSRNAAVIQKALELDLAPNEKAGWLTYPLLQGTAIEDSLESLSRHLSHQAKEKERNNPLM